MIKFFRKIRQHLLVEGKFTQYLKYAVGEIVLVVIGILIALQINNWNEQQKLTAKRNEVLVGITKDLTQDIASHERMIGFYKNRLGFFERHLQKTDFSTTAIDTLFKIFDGGAGMHKVADQSYQKAKNLGIVQLCSDDSLSVRINKYYVGTAEFTNILFDYDFSQTDKQNDFWIANQNKLEHNNKSSLQIPIMQDSLERRVNALALIGSPIGRNNIKSECLVKEMMLGYNIRLLKTSKALLSDIEAYLKAN